MSLTLSFKALNGRPEKDTNSKPATISSPPVAIFNVGYQSQLAS